MTLPSKRSPSQTLRGDIPAHQCGSFSTADMGTRWTAQASFHCYGARIGLQCNSRSILGRILDKLPPYSKIAAFRTSDPRYSLHVPRRNERGTVHRPYAIYMGKSLAMHTNDLQEALDYLESSLHFAVATLARPLFVHAGVVAWKDLAILIPGRSFSGKTSLVEQLVRHGAIYYSDEFAVLDCSGQVHPYPKPLSIRRRASAPRKVECTELGGEAGTRAIKVGAVVMTRYAAKAAWNPRTMTPAETMMALLDNTVMARDRAEDAMKILPLAVSRVRGWQGNRGEASEVAGWLAGCFADTGGKWI